MKVALTVIMLTVGHLVPPVAFFDSVQECFDEKEQIENSFIVTVFRGTERTMIDMAKGKYEVICSVIK